MGIDPCDQRIQELKTENARRRQLIQALQDRVEELESAAARQAAPFRRKEKDRKPQEPYATLGRKPGHPAAPRGAKNRRTSTIPSRLD